MNPGPGPVSTFPRMSQKLKHRIDEIVAIEIDIQARLGEPVVSEYQQVSYVLHAHAQAIGEVLDELNELLLSIQKQINDLKKREPDPVVPLSACCPKCGTGHAEIEFKRDSLGKWLFRCGRCGYTWEPRA